MGLASLSDCTGAFSAGGPVGRATVGLSAFFAVAKLVQLSRDFSPHSSQDCCPHVGGCIFGRKYPGRKPPARPDVFDCASLTKIQFSPGEQEDVDGMHGRLKEPSEIGLVLGVFACPEIRVFGSAPARSPVHPAGCPVVTSVVLALLTGTLRFRATLPFGKLLLSHGKPLIVRGSRWLYGVVNPIAVYSKSGAGFSFPVPFAIASRKASRA
jgi:hypothetical protein